MRDRYFQKMYFYKYSIYYLEAYLDKTVKKIRLWKILIAVGSSAAIACWTAWSNFAYVWGLVVVIAQVASVILEYMPYEERKSELSKAITLKNPIFLEMEHKWDEINIDSLDDEEILNLLFKFEKKWNQTEEAVFKESSLEQNDSIKKHAEKEAQLYFKNIYEVET